MKIGGLVKCHIFKLVENDFFVQNFQGLIPMKMWQIVRKSMDVVHPLGLSGCPKKGYFSVKNVFLDLLALKLLLQDSLTTL